MAEVARRRRTAAVGAIALTVMLGAACGGGGDPETTSDSVEHLADAYVAVLGEMLPSDDTAEDPMVVYVWQFAETPMTLDDQVVVIDSLADEYDVRFVDKAAAAVDPDSSLVPTRDDGLLVGLGPVTVDAPHTVRIEVYTSEADIEAYLLTLERPADTWVVTAQEPVEPEVLGAVL